MKKSKETLTYDLEAYNFEYMSHSEMEEILSWIRLIRKMKYKSILIFEKVIVQESCINLYYLNCKHGTLQEILMTKSNVFGITQEPFIACLALQLLNALSYLHCNMNVIHRGLCPNAIYIDSKATVKLGGLKNCILLQQGDMKCTDFPTRNTACIPWYSPELLEQEYYGYSFNSDVYSLGLVIANVFTGRIPYFDCDYTLILLKKLNVVDVPNLVVASERAVASVGLRSFYRCCTVHNPRQRPSASQLLSHSFVRSASSCPRSVWKKVVYERGA